MAGQDGPGEQGPRIYSADLQPAMQMLLSTLANLDADHMRDLQKLEGSAIPGSLRPQIAAKLKSRHRERREPYVRSLDELYRRIGVSMHTDAQAV